LLLLEEGEVDQWLHGTVEEARALFELTPVEEFNAAPVEGPTF
jgi:putative SOS response-associated peptidase YedK